MNEKINRIREYVLRGDGKPYIDMKDGMNKKTEDWYEMERVIAGYEMAASTWSDMKEASSKLMAKVFKKSDSVYLKEWNRFGTVETIEDNKLYVLLDGHIYTKVACEFLSYGRTWALTREELEG